MILAADAPRCCKKYHGGGNRTAEEDRFALVCVAGVYFGVFVCVCVWREQGPVEGRVSVSGQTIRHRVARAADRKACDRTPAYSNPGRNRSRSKVQEKALGTWSGCSASKCVLLSGLPMEGEARWVEQGPAGRGTAMERPANPVRGIISMLPIGMTTWQAHHPRVPTRTEQLFGIDRDDAQAGSSFERGHDDRCRPGL